MKQTAITKGCTALVDDDDFERLARLRWFAKPGVNTHYASAGIRLPSGKKTTVTMARVVLAAPPGLMVDHINGNGNGLDNRKENLRLCTNSQNQGNRKSHSRFKGVTYSEASGNWRADIEIFGKHISLGRFDSAETAAAFYDFFALAHWGQFAALNFPKGEKA